MNSMDNNHIMDHTDIMDCMDRMNCIDNIDIIELTNTLVDIDCANYTASMDSMDHNYSTKRLV